VNGAVRLPDGATVEVELDLDGPSLDQLRLSAEREGLAPTDAEALKRYVLCLGTGYLEAEGVVAGAESTEEAYERVHRLLGAVEGELAVLRFHYGESAREFAEEERAHAAHERMAGAHEALIERLEAEIATREERIANLEAALRG
jgi:hypothetical protein